MRCLEVDFSISTDCAFLEMPREAGPSYFSSVPIQKWPATDPFLEQRPLYVYFEARYVRIIYNRVDISILSLGALLLD